jgi:hypothetical protein
MFYSFEGMQKKVQSLLRLYVLQLSEQAIEQFPTISNPFSEIRMEIWLVNCITEQNMANFIIMNH